MANLFLSSERVKTLMELRDHAKSSPRGWYELMRSCVCNIPMKHPCGPSAIFLLVENTDIPNIFVIKEFINMFEISQRDRNWEPCLDRNLLLVLSCIADFLVGPQCADLLDNFLLDYILQSLRHTEPEVVLAALIAMEKLAITTDNKSKIRTKLQVSPTNPLMDLLKYVNSANCVWRQVGFNSRWALDNIFVIRSRKLSYRTVDLSDVHVMLNPNDCTVYMKLSPDGLEARNDNRTFESVRATYRVSRGCYVYECLVLSSGIMQIGWATERCLFRNHDGFGIGDDAHSAAFDGCRLSLWYDMVPTATLPHKSWKSGDIVTCLIDVEAEEMRFAVNGKWTQPLKRIFKFLRECNLAGKVGFYPAVSLMPYQHVCFNFGLTPFRYAPKRPYKVFNKEGVGMLKLAQKQVIPTWVTMKKLLKNTTSEDECSICFDSKANCILDPCKHVGFCVDCLHKLATCPLCRVTLKGYRIVDVARIEDMQQDADTLSETYSDDEE